MYPSKAKNLRIFNTGFKDARKTEKKIFHFLGEDTGWRNKASCLDSGLDEEKSIILKLQKFYFVNQSLFKIP